MGEVAALLTAFLWALSSIFFTTASKEVGSVVLNRMRLLFAVVILVFVHLILNGQPIPLDAQPYRWFWLALSAIVGLALGDTFLFQAYVMVGNRIGTLFMASAPVIGGLLAWAFLGETLGMYEILGIALCVGGIALVVLQKRNGENTRHSRGEYTLGVLCAFLAAACQAGGLILAKKGLVDGYSALSGVLIRMLAAALVMWGLALLQGQARASLQAVFQNRKALTNTLGGTIVGPFIGVWMSLIAVQASHVGIASTLMGMTPIFVLPIAKWGYKENVTTGAVIGTVIALVGVAIIFIL